MTTTSFLVFKIFWDSTTLFKSNEMWPCRYSAWPCVIQMAPSLLPKPLSGHFIQDGSTSNHYQSYRPLWLRGLVTWFVRVRLGHDGASPNPHASLHHQKQKHGPPTHYPSRVCGPPFQVESIFGVFWSWLSIQLGTLILPTVPGRP